MILQTAKVTIISKAIPIFHIFLNSFPFFKFVLFSLRKHKEVLQAKSAFHGNNSILSVKH